MKKGSRYYIYAGDKLLGEISSGAVDKVYTWGVDGLVSQRHVGTNVSYWYHFGPQGETRHLTNSSGNVVGTYTYDAYGKQISTTGGINNNFRYGGKYGYYYDEQVYGMYLAGARWYAPDLYRWMSRDPIEYAGGDNMFAYVAGNPVKYVDPSGLNPWLLTPDTWVDLGLLGNDLVNGSWEDVGIDIVGLAIPGVSTASIKVVKTIKKTTKACDKVSDVSKTITRAKTIKGKTKEELHEYMIEKGFKPRGPDPMSGHGDYYNPRTGRSHHLDLKNSYGEDPHIDINRPKTYRGDLPKRKLPL